MSSTGGKFGPGILVTAAFIGPGTVTTASIAGANYGFALLWALVFSVLATIVLQEMSARLALVTRQGLAQALRNTYRESWLGSASVLLVVAAVGMSGVHSAPGAQGGAQQAGRPPRPPLLCVMSSGMILE